MSKTNRIVEKALEYAPWLVLALLLAVFGALDGRIVSQENLLVVLLQATPIAVLALGIFWVLLTGEIDLSAGHAVSLGAVVMGMMLSSGTGLIPTLAVGFIVCLLAGAINGFLVSALQIPSFIATLATMLMLQGATLIVARSGIILVMNPTLRSFGAFSSTVGVPPTIVFVAVLAFLTWWMARQTTYGLKTYAVGSQPERAQLAGISVGAQRASVFVLSSCYVFMTAVVMISRVPVVNPSVGGISLLLDAIAAAVVGGTSLYGGRGTVSGVVCGAVVISLLTAALRVLGVEPSSLDLYKGLAIVLILLSDRAFALARVYSAKRTLRQL